MLVAPPHGKSSFSRTSIVHISSWHGLLHIPVDQKPLPLSHKQGEQTNVAYVINKWIWNHNKPIQRVISMHPEGWEAGL